MTERFRLAANVLLKRRLNKLVRIDNNVEIDRDYITCAEYQLFIDEMRQQGKNRQPDHWTAEKFPPGDAKKPITGVRSSDAKEFCEWLTNKETLPGLKYRLPKLAETKEISSKIKDVGCWCKDDDTFVIAGITTQQLQSEQQQLADYLIFKDNFILYLDRDLNLYLDLYRDLNQNLYQKITSGQASNLLLIYFPLIFPLLFYQLLAIIYGEVTQNRKIIKKIDHSLQEYEHKSKKYAQKRDEISQLYAHLVLIDQRQKGNMSAWEGIRIVREREEVES